MTFNGKAPAELQLDEGRGTHMGGGFTASIAPPADVLPAALPWAAGLITAGGPNVPDYGSPAWHALSVDSPARVAACVAAAEAWRIYWSPAEHARRLHAELNTLREYEEPAVWSPEIVAGVHRAANRPTFAELCDRRGEPEKAARTRQTERRLGLVPIA